MTKYCDQQQTNEVRFCKNHFHQYNNHKEIDEDNTLEVTE